MMTPGQASRIACWISRETSISHDGKWPLPGACWRRWICMTLAPALKAALASRAICPGVTGTWCCFGSVSTPFSAQVMKALSLMTFDPDPPRRGVLHDDGLAAKATCVDWLFLGCDNSAPPTAVIPRACGVSSTPRLLDSIAGGSGILDHPLSRMMTAGYSFAISPRVLREFYR